MSGVAGTSLDFLSGLGNVTAGAAGDFTGRVNTHVHLPPNYSAFASVEQAVDLAAGSRLAVLGADNYYDYSVYRRFAQAAQRRGVFPLFNTEIIALEKDLQAKGVRVNDPGNPGKFYVGGIGITRFEAPTAKAQKLMQRIGGNDQERMAAMVAKMAEVFGEHGIKTKLDDVALRQNIANRYHCDVDTVVLQERHVAQAFQEAFFKGVEVHRRKEALAEMLGVEPKFEAEDGGACQQALRSQLMKVGRPCYVEEAFVNLAQARELIHELGGIACYPVLADGTSPYCEFEATAEKLVENMRIYQLCMVEFINLRNSPEIILDYVKKLRQAGIAVLSGTEHNTMDMANILPQCRGGVDVPEELIHIFWEGACVAAAHQFKTARGETGFVDASGRPNEAFGDAEERIGYFARLGAAVIKAYRDKYGHTAISKIKN